MKVDPLWRIHMKIKDLMTIALLVAVAIVVSLFELPIIPNASFLKLDFSDVLFIVIAVYFGMKGLTIAAFIKAMFLYLTASDIIGIATNVLATIVLAGVYYIGYKTTKKVVISAMLATIALSVILSVSNYMVFLPLYIHLFQYKLGAIEPLVLYAILPFNVIKGTLVTIVASLLLTRLKQLKWVTR